MKKISEFIRREKLYILLLVFIAFITFVVATSQSAKTSRSLAAGQTKAAEEELFNQENIRKILLERKGLATAFNIATLTVFMVIFIGIGLDIILLALKGEGRAIDIRTYEPRVVKWGLLDVAKVVILFFFFGYVSVIIESFLAGIFPAIKNSNFRMILNASLMDGLGILFIIYFAVYKCGDKLISLGISARNFFKNIVYGLMGYAALVPVLIATLILIAVAAKILNYTPERQPVVELFLKERNAPFLIYTSLFASIAGPIMEELFFRGFMYNALKKHTGAIWAALLTAAIFAGLHTNLVGFLPIMMLGLLLAYIYEKTGTIVASMTVHIVHNVSMVALVFLIKQLQ